MEGVTAVHIRGMTVAYCKEGVHDKKKPRHYVVGHLCLEWTVKAVHLHTSNCGMCRLTEMRRKYCISLSLLNNQGLVSGPGDEWRNS